MHSANSASAMSNASTYALAMWQHKTPSLMALASVTCAASEGVPLLPRLLHSCWSKLLSAFESAVVLAAVGLVRWSVLLPPAQCTYRMSSCRRLGITMGGAVDNDDDDPSAP
jgi:hypothetical protein